MRTPTLGTRLFLQHKQLTHPPIMILKPVRLTDIETNLEVLQLPDAETPVLLTGTQFVKSGATNATSWGTYVANVLSTAVSSAVMVTPPILAPT